MKTQTPNPNPCHTISLVYPQVMLRILQIIQMFMHYVIEVVLINHVNSLSFVLSVFFLQLLRYLKILHLVPFNYQLSNSILTKKKKKKKKEQSHQSTCLLGDHRTPLVQWSFYKYKYLQGVGSNGRGSSLQEGASHTYTLKLGQKFYLVKKKN